MALEYFFCPLMNNIKYLFWSIYCNIPEVIDMVYGENSDENINY